MKLTTLPAPVALVFCLALPALADDTPVLHPIEEACVDYEMSGQMQNGTVQRCHRNNGYEAFEIMDVTAGFAGFSQSQNMHSITIGEWIYAIDLTTNSGTKSRNPFYDQIVANANSDAADTADAWMSAMGFEPSGASKTIAGTDCDVYSSSMMGIVCLTDDGLMLEQSFMGNTTVAVNVVIGEPGDDANYTLYQNVTITDGPDLSDMGEMDMDQLMQQMQQMQQQQQ